MIAVLAAVLLAAVVSVAYILKLRGEEVRMSDDKAAKLLSSASALLPDSADFVLVLNEKGSYTAVYNRTAAFTGGSGSLTGEEAENSAAKLAAAARKVISQRLYTSVNATRIFGGNEQYVQLALTDSGASLFDGCIGGYFSFEFSDGNLTSYTLSIELPDNPMRYTAVPDAIPAVPLQPSDAPLPAVAEFPAVPAVTVVSIPAELSTEVEAIPAGNRTEVQTIEDWQKSRENIGGLPFIAETEPGKPEDLAGKTEDLAGEEEMEAKPVLAGNGEDLAGREAVLVSSATSIMRKSETRSATQLDALGVPRVQGNAQLMEPQDSVLEELEQDFEENYEYEMEDDEEMDVGRGCWFFGCRS